MNQIGDIIPVYLKKYANARPDYCRIIKITKARYVVRKLRVSSHKYGQIEMGRWLEEYQLDFNDYPEDELKYVKLNYIEPYVGNGLFSETTEG
jgi:hypothetical protein